MQEWLSKLLNNIREVWDKWTIAQKLTFGGIVVGVLLAIVLLVVVSGSSGVVPLLTRPIDDAVLLDRIATRIDQENVSYQITSDQRILVESDRIARRLRALLTREDLIPQETDPWELFDMQRWTETDFERNVNLQRAITRQLEQHISALDDVDAVDVTLVVPEPELFNEDQNPSTASVIISPKPGSDIRKNHSKIEGIQKLIQFAVEGLTPENITITDRQGIVLNDFEGTAEIDRIELTRRELHIKREVEQRYIDAIRNALGEIYSERRVEILNIDVALNQGRRTQEIEEHYPIVTVPDNPQTPFDESEFVLAIPRSTETVAEDYEGTGFNPEGPPGQEGQTPPAYRDLEGLVGRWSNDEERINNELNTRRIYEEKSPEVTRITASVALDGIWKWVYDENGDLVVNPDSSIQREYIPVSQQELSDAKELMRDAIGFDQSRGDSVSVKHIQFDRTEEQRQEDMKRERAMLQQLIIIYVLIAVAAILFIFILFRLIYREVERRRRLRQEELERQHAAVREAALQSEASGMEIQMSVEERTRLELQENAINMAREHPEDVARLLKTWITES